MFVFLCEYGIIDKISKLNEWEIEMKLRRSDRMVVISNYLINNPYKLTSLNTLLKSMNLLNHPSQKISSLSNVPLRKLKSVISKQ